jgi:trimeric autotransporter adhesin
MAYKLQQLLLSLAITSAIPLSVTAQCQHSWLPGGAYPGVNGAVATSTWWDPDGAGPAPEHWIVGGTFTAAGGVEARNIAAWNPVVSEWSTFGAGADQAVLALAVLPNGHLVAGGQFTTIGGVAAARIARWNGTSWSPMAGGVNGRVRSLLVTSTGDLLVGGDFSLAGGITAARIARWDGNAWSSLGTGTNGSVATLCALPNGDIIAAGAFTSAGGTATIGGIARWQGSSWSAIPGVLAGAVTHATVMSSGDLVANGAFSTLGGTAALARFDGTAWISLGSPGSDLSALAALPNNELMACAYPGYGAVHHLLRWNGWNWTFVQALNVTTISPRGSTEQFIGGQFRHTLAGASNVLRLTGAATASALMQNSAGISAPTWVSTMTSRPNGDLVVATNGSLIGGTVASVANWNGVSWSVVVSTPTESVHRLHATADDALYVSSYQSDTYGNTSYWFRRLAGGTTTQFQSPPFDVAVAMTDGPAGSLVVAGTTASGTVLRRLTGGTWSMLGNWAGDQVFALATLPNGDVIAGGDFSSAGGIATNRLARFDGVSWAPLGAGVDGPVYRLLAMSNGDLIAAGDFTNAGGAPAQRIARWNGSTWSPLGSGFAGNVRALLELPNADVFVGGDFTTAGGVPTPYLARWTGTGWIPGPAGPNGQVLCLGRQVNGDIAVGGAFNTVGTLNSSHLASLTTTCPALVSSHGAGCAGSGGSNILAASSLPWLGSTFRATASGLPLTAIAITVTGFAPTSQALAALLPQGIVGCDLLVTPELLTAAAPTGGAIDLQLPLPYAPSIAGMFFYQQVVALEVDALGNFVAVTGTNGLKMTTGLF